MNKKEILDILDNAKDERGEVPMRLVRQAFDKLVQPEERTETHAESHACVSISRQDAIDALKICDNNDDGINCYKCPLRDKRWDGAWKNEETYCYKKLMRDSAELLSAQPERRTGYWIQYDQRFCWSKDYKCSECGNYINSSGINGGRGDANYCPNCGAKMKGIKVLQRKGVRIGERRTDKG